MRRSIDNGLLPAVTQQDIDKRLENERSLGHRRHSDIVEGSKSNVSNPNASKQSSLLPTASPTGRALSTPLPPTTTLHTGLAWDISSMISSQTGNTGGTGQDTGLGSLMYSMTTSGTNSQSTITAPPPAAAAAAMSSDSSRTSSTIQLNLSSQTSRTTTTNNTTNNSPVITTSMGKYFPSPHNRVLPPFTRPSLRRALSLEGMGMYSDRGAPVMCKMPSAGKSFADIAETLQSIPTHSWIMPYIFACSGSGVLRRMEELPMALPPPRHQGMVDGSGEGIEAKAGSKQKEEGPQIPQLQHQAVAVVASGKGKESFISESMKVTVATVDVDLVQKYPYNDKKQINNQNNDHQKDVHGSKKISEKGSNKGQENGQEKGSADDDFWNTPIHPGMELMVQLKSGAKEEEEGADRGEREEKERGKGLEEKKQEMKQVVEGYEKGLTGNEKEAKKEPFSSSSSSETEFARPIRHSFSLTHIAVIDSYDFRPELLSRLPEPYRLNARAKTRSRSDLGQAQVLSDSIIVLDHSSKDKGGDKEKGGEHERPRTRSRSDIGLTTTSSSKSPPSPGMLDALLAFSVSSSSPPAPPPPAPPPVITIPQPPVEAIPPPPTSEPSSPDLSPFMNHPLLPSPSSSSSRKTQTNTLIPPPPPQAPAQLLSQSISHNEDLSVSSSSADLSPFITHPFNTTTTMTTLSPALSQLTPSQPTSSQPTPSHFTLIHPTPSHVAATPSTTVSPSPRIDKAVALIRSSAGTPLSSKNHGTPPPPSSAKKGYYGSAGGGPSRASPYGGRKSVMVNQGTSLLMGKLGQEQGQGLVQGQGPRLESGQGQGQGPGPGRSTVRSTSVPTRSPTITSTSTLPIRVPTKTITTTTATGGGGSTIILTSSPTCIPFSKTSFSGHGPEQGQGLAQGPGQGQGSGQALSPGRGMVGSLSTSRSSEPMLGGSLGTSSHLPDLNVVTMFSTGGTGGGGGVQGHRGGHVAMPLSNRNSEPCLATLSTDSNSTHSYLRQSPSQSQSQSQSSTSQSQSISLAHSQSSHSLSKSASQPPSLAQSLSSPLQSPANQIAMSLSSTGSSHQESVPLILMHAPRPSYAYELNPRPLDQQSKLYFQSRISPPTASPGLTGGGVLRPSSNSPPVPVHSIVQSSWRSLGVVWLNRDPSWRPWELRQVYLCDNYLLECTIAPAVNTTTTAGTASATSTNTNGVNQGVASAPGLAPGSEPVSMSYVASVLGNTATTIDTNAVTTTATTTSTTTNPAAGVNTTTSGANASNTGGTAGATSVSRLVGFAQLSGAIITLRPCHFPFATEAETTPTPGATASGPGLGYAAGQLLTSALGRVFTSAPAPGPGAAMFQCPPPSDYSPLSSSNSTPSGRRKKETTTTTTTTATLATSEAAAAGGGGGGGNNTSSKSERKIVTMAKVVEVELASESASGQAPALGPGPELGRGPGAGLGAGPLIPTMPPRQDSLCTTGSDLTKDQSSHAEDPHGMTHTQGPGLGPGTKPGPGQGPPRQDSMCTTGSDLTKDPSSHTEDLPGTAHTQGQGQGLAPGHSLNNNHSDMGATSSSPAHVLPNCLAIHIACLPNSRVRSSAPRVEFYLRLPDHHDQPSGTGTGSSPGPCAGASPSLFAASPGPGPHLAERRCVDFLRQENGSGLNLSGNEKGWTRQALAQALTQAQAQGQGLDKRQEQKEGLKPEQTSTLAQDQETVQPPQGQGLASVASSALASASLAPDHASFPSLVGGTRIGQLFEIIARASELTLAHMFAFQSRHSDSSSEAGSSGKKDSNEIKKATRRSYPYPTDITNNYLSSSDSGTSNTELSEGAVALYIPTTTTTTATTAAAAAAPTTTKSSNNLVAVKVVPKQEFWQRVLTGKERPDTLVREVLAQFVACQPLSLGQSQAQGPGLAPGPGQGLTTTQPGPGQALVSAPSSHPAVVSARSSFVSCNSRTSTPNTITTHAHAYKKEHVTVAEALTHTMPIVQIFGAYETVDTFALELELMQDEDLFDRLSRLGVFSERHTQQIVYQLVEAVLSCNRHGIAHRDIKLSNITFPPLNQTFSQKRQRYLQQQRQLQWLVQQQQQQQQQQQPQLPLQQQGSLLMGKGTTVAVSVGDSNNDNTSVNGSVSVGGTGSVGGSISVTGCSSVSVSDVSGVYGLTRSPSSQMFRFDEDIHESSDHDHDHEVGHSTANSSNPYSTSANSISRSSSNPHSSNPHSTSTTTTTTPSPFVSPPPITPMLTPTITPTVTSAVGFDPVAITATTTIFPADTGHNQQLLQQQQQQQQQQLLLQEQQQQQQEPDHMYIKLADFGMAGFIGRDGRLRGRCGTPGYVAPDILKAGLNETYCLNVDMFSIGVVAYTLLCGYEPFFGNDDQELISANKNVDFEFHMPEWGHISAEAKDWICRALSPVAGERMTPIKAKNHPWLAALR